MESRALITVYRAASRPGHTPAKIEEPTFPAPVSLLLLDDELTPTADTNPPAA
jgi:hypothetical protein